MAISASSQLLPQPTKVRALSSSGSAGATLWACKESKLNRVAVTPANLQPLETKTVASARP